MYRDPSEFRERFKAYKDGKSVREIYGLPGYSNGKFDAATKKKIDYYYKLLRNNGFDMMSAVGILGNMMQESSFDPNVVNHLGYHGLLLNSKAILNAIKRQYGDLSELSQLRYLSDWTDGATWIRKGPSAKDTALYSKSYLRNGYKTPELAAYEFLKRYERAIVVDKKTNTPLRDANGNYIYQDKDKRIGYAKSIYNYLSGRPDGIQELIALVGKTLPEPIIATQDATRVSTIPTVQQQAIDYSDRRNAVAAEAERAMWAHNVMEDMKGAYQVPIWESPSLPALTPVEYDVTPLKTYAGGKVAEEDEPVIRQGTKGSRLDRFSRMMDPDEDDGTVTRVIKKVGKGVADLVDDAKTVSGLRTAERFATHTLSSGDYVDAAFLTVGNAMISKMLKASPKLYMKNFIQSFTDMDARALGKYFFLEHPELMTKPQEAWYGELAKKSDAYFRQAISHRARLFDKAGKPLSPESIAAQISPDIKIAPIKGSRYGGIYSAPDNTMLINSDLVNDPRTAARVYNHERAHSMLTAFENEVGLPYPVNYGVEMEALFPFTAEQKAKRSGVHLGKEIDASLHEVKSLRSYDTDQLGRALDVDFLNMSDEEFRLYANNGYFKDVMLNILNGLQAQKKFISKLKDGKLPGYSNGKIRIKPANRGKFNATKKRTGKTTEELTHSKNPLTRKRAIFALNARKWHHADGKLPGYENGVFPWGEDDTREKTEQWADDWASRVTTSRVLKEWNKTGVKPKAESSDEYTNRRVKEETKRTWLSDAADISHGIGEAVMAMDPYTAIPYFGAKIGTDVVNGNVGMHTALDATAIAGNWLFNYINPNSLLNQNIRTALYNNKIPYGYNLLDINIPKSYIEGSIEALRGNKIQQLAKPNWFNKSGNILGSTGEASARPLTEMHQNHRAAAWARYLGLDDTLLGVGYIPSRKNWVTKMRDPYFENAYRAQIYEKLQKGHSSLPSSLLKGTISDKSVYNTAGGMGYEINPSTGVVRIFDVWDLLPFKNLNIPILKNFEASQILPGAKPFNFETYTSIPM